METLDVKSGDEVIRHYRYGSPEYTIEIVHHVTPTGIIVLQNHERYSKTGQMRGTYHMVTATIEQITPAKRIIVRKQMLVYRYERIRWDAYTLEQLQKVEAILLENTQIPGVEPAR